MSRSRFDLLIHKVQRAEQALEAHERRAAADLRQLRDSWRELWTPGRIVLVGLAAGFLAGRAEPARLARRGGGAIQSALHLVSMLSGLFAGHSAQAAAGEAEQAAASAQEVAETAGTGNEAGASAARAPESAATAAPRTGADPDSDALAHGEAAQRAARAATADTAAP